MEQGETVDPNEYSVNLKEFPIEGSESKLFRGVDQTGRSVAFKVYSDLTLEQILLYGQITNQLAELHNDKNEYLQLEVKGGTQPFLLHIVPIERTGLVIFEKGRICPCSVCEFVEGPTLHDLEPYYLSDRFTRLKEDPLVKLSRQFCEETGSKKLGVIPWNIKLLLEQEPKVMAITDVSGSIDSIR